ncbi:MAG: hypothetical protein E6Y86_08340 [Slackia sp.]|nr:hypothetical protein [Slackia sp.]
MKEGLLLTQDHLDKVAAFHGHEFSGLFMGFNTEHGSFWTHGNATKHMNEAVTTLKGSQMMTNTNPDLLSQFVLYDYRKALNKVTSQDVKLGHMYESDHWSIMFKKKKGDANTVVVHALFKGFK